MIETKTAKEVISYGDCKAELYRGDAFEVMDQLVADGVTVDSIITDIPYGTTACKWDSVLPFNKHIIVKKGKKDVVVYEDEYILSRLKTSNQSYGYIRDEFNELAKDGMWERLNKLIKPNGAIVLFGSEPFSSALRMSNIKNFKYDWIWEKSKATNFLNSKKQPLRAKETISVFYTNQPTYNPQMIQGKAYNKGIRKAQTPDDVYGGFDQVEVKSEGLRYPRDVLYYKTAESEGETFHKTQKPVALMEYLIKTYTNENELVLDFTMGSGSTMAGCKNTNRNGIGIELAEEYFKTAVNRVS